VYLNAPPEEKVVAKKRYQALLDEFTAHVRRSDAGGAAG
jgi:hypothetical protein